MSSLNLPTVVSAAAILSFAIFYYRRWSYRKGSNIHRLPGPDGAHWLWGHDMQIASRSTDDQYSDWLNKYGETISVKGSFGFGEMAVTADPSVLSHVFTKRPAIYQKALHLRKLYERTVGNSLVSAVDSEHKRMKAAIAPAFTAERIRGMGDVVMNATQTLVSNLRSFLTEEQKKSGGAPILVNAMDWSNRAGLDVIAGVGWGWDLKCGTTPEAEEIHTLWRTWNNKNTSRTSFVVGLVYRTFPWLNYLPIPLKTIQEQTVITKRIAKLVRPVAVERVAQIKAGILSAAVEEENPDILSFLIRGSLTAGEEVDIDEVVEHMIHMVIVGSETSASHIAYVLNALARNPDVQDKLRAELEEFDREPSYDDLHNPKVLRYLDAVTKEGFRAFPVLAHTERTVLADDVIPLSKPVTGKDGKLITELRVKAGQTIAIPFMSITTHSAVWGPDGKVFRPSRWLDESETPPRAMPGGYQNLSIFGEGPRLCTGYRLAVFEVKAVIAAVVRNFRLIDTGLEVTSRFVAALQPFVVGAPKDMEGVYMPLKMELLDRD